MKRAILCLFAILAGCATTSVRTIEPEPQMGALLGTTPSIPRASVLTPAPKSQSIDIMKLLTEGMETAPEIKCPAAGACVKTLEIGDVDEEAMAEAVGWLDAAEAAKVTGIVVHIDSNGGRIDSGMQLIQRLEKVKVPVTCVVDYRAFSMGAAILEGAGCKRRLATPRAILMFHEVLIGGQMGGSERFFTSIAGRLHAIEHMIQIQCSKRLKITMEEFSTRTTNGAEWWINPDEAVSIGAIDGVVESVAAAEAELADGP